MIQRLRATAGSTSRLLRQLRYGQINSAAVRRLLARFYRPGGVYRIPYGPLAGARIKYDRAINYHVMLGLWELQSLSLLGRLLKLVLGGAPATACDVGANIGFYTLWLHRALAPGSVVYAFEPAPFAFACLNAHVELNRATSAQPLRLAVGDRVGEVSFFLGYHHHSSSLNAAWAGGGHGAPECISVPGTTLDAFCAEQGRWPDFIKVDIEGGAVHALKGFAHCVERKRPLVLIESHTPDEDRAISDLIVGHDYHAYRLTDSRWVGARTSTYPDPDGVWGTLLLLPAEARGRLSRLIDGRRPAR